MTLKMGAFEALDENEMLAVDGGKINLNEIQPQHIAGGLMPVTSALLMMNPGTFAVGSICLDAAATLFF